MQNKTTFQHIKNGVKNSYGVLVSFSKEQLTTNYIIDVSYQQYRDDNYIAHLHRKHFFINGVESKKTLDTLALRCANLMYPIKFETTSLGKLIALNNFNEIQQRFFTKLPRLEKEFTGAVADHYFTELRKSVATQKTFEYRLKNDLFYSLFFNEYPSMFTANNTANNIQISLPIQPYKSPITFIGTQQTEKQKEFYQVTFNGVDTNGNTLVTQHTIIPENFSLKKVTSYYNKDKNDSIDFSIKLLKERSQNKVSFLDKSIEQAEKIKGIKPQRKWFNIFKKEKK